MSLTEPELAIFFTAGVNGFPGSATAGPSSVNHASQAFIAWARSSSVSGIWPPPKSSRYFAMPTLLRLEVPLGPSDPTTNGAALYRQVEDEMHQLAGLQARELFETL